MKKLLALMLAAALALSLSACGGDYSFINGTLSFSMFSTTAN